VAIRRAVRIAKRGHRRAELTSTGGTLASADHAVDPDLLAAIRGLPARQRAAIVLHYFEDCSLADVAEALKCSPATAKVHVFNGRRRLAALLGGASTEGSVDVD
jgi:RNA polymerase sigma-70 factor (ECF subfamily)